ncbi:hypothetical protein E1218_13860 [Kribbella turkmenica]|uniref:Ribosomal protein L7/L12 C-terminal domain-containing protein n=1 Tax=Kribbella turkmenica TaxID=2530375 RepID=A0A4R4X6Z6_9ACTN|nr:hypothetical protein [Kribbella turkmenica]TDD26049.1 hypothetical protein E1218_13860 [Kribbella turkmenica]
MVEFAIFVIVMIVVSVIGKARQQASKSGGRPNPRMQKLIERMQAQQGGNVPTQFQGQFTRPTGGQVPPPQFQPQYQPPAQWLPSYGPPQGHRPPQHHLPAARNDTDARVRELMEAGSEVAAIRLLCDEQDMGILEAQEHARALVGPPGTSPTPARPAQSAQAGPAAPEQDEQGQDEQGQDEPETRYVGSAAFAESIFDLDRDEDTWASGWVDTPEPDDRSDIDELWQTVRNPPRPGTTPPS